MTKKLVFSLALIVVLISSPISSYAQQPTVYQQTETIQTELGDLNIETTLIVYDSFFLTSSEKHADKIKEIKLNDSLIATVTLSATFGYDGESAWVKSADSSHTTSAGWLYSNENITSNDSTASLSALILHLSFGTIPVSLSITCSPTGAIS